MIRKNILLTGVLQGVGFRPFVYRLAKSMQLSGWVRNTRAGLEIDIEGAQRCIEQFLHALNHDNPPPSVLETIVAKTKPTVGYTGFTIKSSAVFSKGNATATPDQNTCQHCLQEMRDPQNHRYHYPFIACAQCGPRYSIMLDLPFERELTAYRDFPLCAYCQAEYDDPDNRRFYAQTTSCPQCGPHMELWDKQRRSLASHDEAVLQTIELIKNGNIVAVKGMGGFHFICDASNARVVEKLRMRKKRPHKPFAMMLANCDEIKKIANLSATEETLLASVAAPIVLLRKKDATLNNVAANIAYKLNHYGIILPYSPIHHLLIDALALPLVVTSANVSGQPLCADNDEALTQLGSVADFFLLHNRAIINPCDDSVLQVVSNKAMMLRRARGYSTLPISIKASQKQQKILAVGGHLKNSVALLNNQQVFMSPHVGDLSTPLALLRMQKAIQTLQVHHGCQATHVVCDAHPSYQSTIVAEQMQLPLLTVQHHYAHALACVLEHQLSLPVFAVVWDGTGYGADNTVWGGEFLLLDKDGFRRFAHIRPFLLPGAEKAIAQPRRCALGVLYALFGDNLFTMLPSWLQNNYSESERKLFLAMLHAGINTPWCTSIGRLFDALAAILKICQINSYEGQAAMELEACAQKNAPSFAYSMPISKRGVCYELDWRPMLQQLLVDMAKDASVSHIATAIHLCLVSSIVALSKKSTVKSVILTGGVFQNQFLLERSIVCLEKLSCQVFWPQQVPANDGGIALGQIMAGVLNKW